MICISINQESRRLALVDMLNAARSGDLLEIRLDRFGKAPEIGELLARKPKPVIVSCRRPRDGGFWEGSETERLAILRQAIIAKADYVEIELDVADEIRRFPPSQRVISYTNLSETPADLAEIYDEAKTKNPDVIKLTTLARTPEEAWPLVQILARAVVPTVVVGLGRPGMMLSLLSRKIGAPWIYAALEKGMEAYPGQATVDDLQRIYRLGDIDKGTRFVGVTGFGPAEILTTGALNGALHQLEMPFRCLPMGVGNAKLFRKILDAVKIGAAIVDPANQQGILDMGLELHGAARMLNAADVLIRKGEAWHGFHVSSQAWIEGLVAALREKFPVDDPVKDRMVMIVGLTAAANVLAREIQRRGGNAILASRRRKAGQQLAQEIGCRFVQFDALYSTMHDVLIVCDEETAETAGQPGGQPIHGGYFKPGMTVMDLTALQAPSKLLREAQDRGCRVVSPRALLLDRWKQQVRLLTGKVPAEETLAAALPEEEE